MDRCSAGRVRFTIEGRGGSGDDAAGPHAEMVRMTSARDAADEGGDEADQHGRETEEGRVPCARRQGSGFGLSVGLGAWRGLWLNL